MRVAMGNEKAIGDLSFIRFYLALSHPKRFPISNRESTMLGGEVYP